MDKRRLYSSSYLALLYIVSGGLIVFLLVKEGSPPLAELALFSILNVIAQSFPVPLAKSAWTSVGFAIMYASLLLFGPVVAAIVGLFGALNGFDIFVRKAAPYKIAFNVAQDTLYMGISGLVYTALGGPVGGLRVADFPWALVPLVLAALVGVILNTLMVSLVISIREGGRWFYIWRYDNLKVLPNFFMLAVLGVFLAQAYVVAGFVGIVLLFAPLTIARQTVQVYMRLRESYNETVQALVKVIEAKDAYTSGHSERVAEYAEAIGRQMKLSEETIETLKHAAVLHDIGKIGVLKRVLGKLGQLTSEEYQQIQRHPETGANIIREIGFLKEAVPAVFYHHERPDGTGYVEGIAGGQIPLLARIIAVADSFDAMTRARAYRRALTLEEAAAELKRCCGFQFDARVVEALLSALGLDQVGESEQQAKEEGSLSQQGHVGQREGSLNQPGHASDKEGSLGKETVEDHPVEVRFEG